MDYNPKNKDLTKSKLIKKQSFRKHSYITRNEDRRDVAKYIQNNSIIRLKEVSVFENNIERMTIEIWLDLSEAANGA